MCPMYGSGTSNNPDTNGTEESVHSFSEVSSFQRLKNRQEWYTLGVGKVSCLERCPQFRVSLYIEDFHCIVVSIVSIMNSDRVDIVCGTSSNGHSEERTTSLQWTSCVPPANNCMHVRTSEEGHNLRIMDKTLVPNVSIVQRFHCIQCPV